MKDTIHHLSIIKYMLVKLLGSNARVQILKLFLLHPNNKYYIRQLSRDLELQVNSVRRELENLEKFGLLFSALSVDATGIENGTKSADAKGSSVARKQGNGQEKKYYQADKNFVLYEEVRALIAKSQVLYEEEFVEKIKKAGKIKLLILTGVFSGNLEAQTDILVVGTVAKNKVVKIVEDLEKKLGREINFTILNSQEFKYRKDITDVFLYSILEGKFIKAVDEMG